MPLEYGGASRKHACVVGRTHDDDDHAVFCSFLETNFVYLWGGYVLHQVSFYYFRQRNCCKFQIGSYLLCFKVTTTHCSA